LKQILLNHLEKDTNISVDYFKNKLKEFESIDFSDNFYTASGVGRVRIYNTFLLKIGYKKIDSIKKEIEKKDYVRLLNLES
jgi:hypothetical protein